MGGYNTGPGSVTALDSTTKIVDDGDTTKVLQFQCSGITTGTTRTVTVQDANGTMYITGGTDVAVADGGTGLSSYTANNVIYASGTTTIAGLATANNGTLKTDSAGAPSINVAPCAEGWFHNLAIVTATTTNANDSIKITSAGGTALSSTNSAWIDLPGTTAGQTTRFSVTADVTILVTGAHWGIGTTGDITGALLRVLAINDNGTLRWGIAYLGGRNTVLTTDTTATQTSVTTPEGVLTTAAVASATNTCRELGFVRSNFDDTGGAAEDLWANQTGVGDIVTGKIADGLWQPWNPTFTGFSVNPSSLVSRWTQIGRVIWIRQEAGTAGTSNATTFTITLPAKAAYTEIHGLGAGVNNGSGFTTSVRGDTLAGSTTVDLYIDFIATAWTGANAKNWRGKMYYEVGPTASFIE